MKKILAWLALGVAVMWAVKNPAQVASIAHQVMHAVATLASSL